jgi:hypothetical protein
MCCASADCVGVSASTGSMGVAVWLLFRSLA